MTGREPHAVMEAAGFVARALSEGRRQRARLLTGPGAATTTDLVDVFVGWPLVDGAERDWLTCAVALQSSPTKELVAALPVDALTRRERAALQLVEGAAAVGWVTARWPGLRQPLRRLAEGVDPSDAEGLTPQDLLDRALALAAAGEEHHVPPILGQPPLVASRVSKLRATQAAIESRVPWSFERRRRRLSAFSIPVTGPSPSAAPAGGGRSETAMLLDHRKSTAGIPYPEWDGLRGLYREDYVTVVETRLTSPATTVAPGAGRRFAAWFEQPLERRSRGRLEEGSDIDVDAVVDARCDDLAAKAAHHRLYRDRVATSRDVACAVLVDRSGSVAQAGVLAQELACADALVAAMEAARERHAVFSFWSDGPGHVAVEVLRDFDARNPLHPSRAGLRPTGYTRLGAAVRHATARLLHVDAARRVLLVLSDCVPCDDGYEGEYACADVVRAVEEAERAGVALALVAVGQPPRDRLAELLPGHLRRVRDVDQLAPVLAGVHARLVAA